ncbi:MAG: MerR family transcriptional regulator [Anaerolineales bacterium]
MIQIGTFSKLSRVSIKTLRYYDNMDLLKPVHVDEWTGYRYYAFEQLPRLNRILALKDLGFSLAEIGNLLEEDVSLEQLHGMLRVRQSEAQQRVRDEQERLERIKARLKQIELEDKMSEYDVVIKQVDPITVACVRDTIPSYSQQARLWKALEGYLAMHRVRPSAPCFTLYLDEEYKESEVDAMVCEPINVDLPESSRVKMQELPGAETMACIVHHGPFTSIGEAHQAIHKWIENNGYRVNGPEREIYLNPAKAGSQTDPKTVTEIQYPVEKV